MRTIEWWLSAAVLGLAVTLTTGAWGQTEGESGQSSIQIKPELPAPLCSRAVKPVLPTLSWRGVAAYKVSAQVKAGRVVSLEVKSLRAGVERQVQRSLISSLSDAVRAYQCEGDGSFEQQVIFTLAD